MKVQGKAYRSIWPIEKKQSVGIIDQTLLPHRFVEIELTTLQDATKAIKDMWVRGAPLAGATAAYGVALEMARDPSDATLEAACNALLSTRPTVFNLRWALNTMKALLLQLLPEQRAEAAWRKANEIIDVDVACNEALGAHGLKLIEAIASTKPKGEPVHILTHCNAGWLSTVDWGTATSPIYQAHNKGIPVHVWVDETRPRNQGAGLTTWELGEHGVPHTLLVDSAGGHIMQHGMVDLCIIGTTRTTSHGDVFSKIGAYLKALAAFDNNVPFYVAVPSSTIDWSVKDGIKAVSIEERSGDEVAWVSGVTQSGKVERVRICPPTTPLSNYAFDVTPAKYITGLITERGVCEASSDGLTQLFPELIA